MIGSKDPRVWSTLLACKNQMSVGGIQQYYTPCVSSRMCRHHRFKFSPKANEFHFKVQHWCVLECFELSNDIKRLNGWRVVVV